MKNKNKVQVCESDVNYSYNSNYNDHSSNFNNDINSDIEVVSEDNNTKYDNIKINNVNNNNTSYFSNNKEEEKTIYYSAESDNELNDIIIKNKNSNAVTFNDKVKNIYESKHLKNKLNSKSNISNHQKYSNNIFMSKIESNVKKPNESQLLHLYSKNLEKQLSNKDNYKSESSSSINSFFNKEDDMVSNQLLTSNNNLTLSDESNIINGSCNSSKSEYYTRKKNRIHIKTKSPKFIDPYSKQHDKIKMILSLNDFKKANQYRNKIIRREMEKRMLIAQVNWQNTNIKLDELNTIQNDFKNEDDEENIEDTISEYSEEQVNNTMQSPKKGSNINHKKDYYEMKNNHETIKEESNYNYIKTKAKESIEIVNNKNNIFSVEKNLILSNTIDDEGLRIVEVEEFEKCFDKEVFFEYEQWVPNKRNDL